mgnify:CR=1 FL=1|tara:strand:+ start:331 stop:612 length:282 start_codon:yes stop_codon:yes gene_type:complete
MNRKQRRDAAKQAKKQGNTELQEKISLFGKMPDHCLVCQKEFDKMNKEQVMSWNVVVREKENRVNLYCPQCWEKSLKLIEEIQEALNEKDAEQ